MLSASVIKTTESDKLHSAFMISAEGKEDLIVEYESQLWKRSQLSADELEKAVCNTADYTQQDTVLFLLADGIVWERCSEPAYRVYLDGTVEISVDDSESDASVFKRFNAFQYEETLLTAERIARENRRRKEVSSRPIWVYLPQMVKYPLNPEYASQYDVAGLQIAAEEGCSVEQIAYLAHFLKTERFEVKRIKGKGSDALFLLGYGFWKKKMDSEDKETFRRQVIDILNDTAIKPVPVECQLGDMAIWFGIWHVSEPK